LAFKIAGDTHVGRITFSRVYSGTIKKGGQVFNVGRGISERVSRILRMHSNQREDLDECHAGDIVALIGPKKTFTGDSLTDKKHQILFESIFIPESVIDVAIEPRTKADSDKMADALIKLTEEDPTFHYSFNEETGQIIISGMGELHLEIIVDRLLREHKVEAKVGKPQVAYRETISAEVVGVEGKFIKQTGGKGQYGHVIIDIKPLPLKEAEGKPLRITDKVTGGDIPAHFIRSVEAGIADGIKGGVIAGYPVLGVDVILTGGSSHEVDSSEMAFKAAASIAIQAALKKAKPRLLEPMMRVEVNSPEEYVGVVHNDFNTRRGQVVSISSGEEGYQLLTAEVPLSEMFGYATDLRNKTQGRSVYTMEFMEYAEVPRPIANEIATKWGGTLYD
jgi:elongation factor G